MNRPWTKPVQTRAINTTLALASSCTIVEWSVSSSTKPSGNVADGLLLLHVQEVARSFFFSFSLLGILTHLCRALAAEIPRWPLHTHLPLRDPIVVATSAADDGTCRCIFHRGDPIESRHFYKRGRAFTDLRACRSKNRGALNSDLYGRTWSRVGGKEKGNIVRKSQCSTLVHINDSFGRCEVLRWTLSALNVRAIVKFCG